MPEPTSTEALASAPSQSRHPERSVAQSKDLLASSLDVELFAGANKKQILPLHFVQCQDDNYF
jgi:hypothetical protein